MVVPSEATMKEYRKAAQGITEVSGRELAPALWLYLPEFALSEHQ